MQPQNPIGGEDYGMLTSPKNPYNRHKNSFYRRPYDSEFASTPLGICSTWRQNPVIYKICLKNTKTCLLRKSIKSSLHLF